MIRHRPLGGGHAYLHDLDQRVPVLPVAGTALELRATTSRTADSVRLEVVRAAGGVSVAAERFEPSRPPAPVRGHLAEAASAPPSANRQAWRVVLDDLVADEVVRYRFASTEGNTAWHVVTVASWRNEGGRLVVDGGTRVESAATEWLVAGGVTHAVRTKIVIAPASRVVGFGERFNALDQRGRHIDSVVFEQYKNQGERTYLPVPFALVIDGADIFGFHVDTSRKVLFDVGATDATRIGIETTVDSLAPELRIQVFAGSPAEIVAQFQRATATPKLPPDWVFTPWMSANEWNTQERVEAEVARTAAEGIPAGVLVIEAWSDEETFTVFRDAQYEVHADGSPHALGDFVFPADGAWPDPKGMIDRLHGRDIRVLLWQIPLLRPTRKPESQLAADRRALAESGLAVRQADGRAYANRGWWFPRSLLPDFTSREARAWWLAKRRYLVEELGVDGFKTDGGEHAWGDDLRYADGTRGVETNNRYPQLYAEAYHQLLDDVGNGGITFSRAGFTGAASSPCHWAGDESSTWDAFRASITAGLTAGVSGIFFWGWDIGGFSGELPSAELFLRGAAMACFCPIMQYHAEFNHHRLPSNDRSPWNLAERTNDPRVLSVYRELAKLRMRLVPYLAAEARRSVETGAPLMRPLFFETQDDERIWDFPYQYLLGDAMLVAPVCEEGVTSWVTYLPAGEWVDAWSGERFQGGVEVERPVPLDKIPVYITAERAAHLLPLVSRR